MPRHMLNELHRRFGLRVVLLIVMSGSVHLHIHIVVSGVGAFARVYACA